MTTPYSSQRTNRISAGEFPQPTSPWESRSLLYAEIVGIAVFLAAVVLSTSDVDTLLSKAPSSGTQPTAPATVATAEQSGTIPSLEVSEVSTAGSARN